MRLTVTAIQDNRPRTYQMALATSTNVGGSPMLVTPGGCTCTIGCCSSCSCGTLQTAVE